MTKLWVFSPSKLGMFRIVCIGAGFFAAYHVLGTRYRREFMRRVRIRNDLMRLDAAAIRDLVAVDLRAADGSSVRLADIPGDYLCLFAGSFKDFAKLHAAVTDSQYAAEAAFLFVADQDRLRRANEASRVPLSKT